MTLPKIRIKADRWPWQQNKRSLFMGRFGGGWNWNLGFQAGGRTIILNLLWGSVRISWGKK